MSRAGFVSVPIAEVRVLAAKAVAALGYTKAETDAVVEVLLFAQCRGNSQGLIKLASKALVRDPKCVPPKIVRESPVSGLVDGGQSIGIVAMTQATDMAIAKAKATGIAVVGTVNTSSTTGAIGYYARKLAKSGFIGIVMSQSPELVAPHGSYQPFFGTNPIAVGFPLVKGEPLVLDMATSAMAYYGIVEAKEAGRSIAPGLAYDDQGRETTDPAAAIAGALRPFGGYKGSALALIVELLTGAFVGGAITDKWASKNWGNIILALNPTLFSSQSEVEERAAAVIQHIRGLKRLPGTDSITLPGDRGDTAAAEVQRTGMLPLERPIYDALMQASKL